MSGFSSPPQLFLFDLRWWLIICIWKIWCINRESIFELFTMFSWLIIISMVRFIVWWLKISLHIRSLIKVICIDQWLHYRLSIKTAKNWFKLKRNVHLRIFAYIHFDVHGLTMSYDHHELQLFFFFWAY